MRTLRFLLLMLAFVLLATGCGTRSAFQQKPPPDPLVSSSTKKPITGIPTSGDPNCRPYNYPAPPPVPDMTVRGSMK
jgi:hypothetical protein